MENSERQDNMINVSVIVPVYNVEAYLRPCLDSILNQSLKEIEIICVDDGSTDSCPDILDEYAQKDERVKVIHKPNGGYGNSINIGVDTAIGEYIGIVESDDYILPDMYETLYRYASAYDLDLIKSECIQFWETLNHSRRIHRKEMEPYFSKVLCREDRILFYQFYMNTWSGIYKRQFLEENGIRHNESPGASYQDNGFWIQTMSMCNRGMWLDDAFYMYRQDNPVASVKSKEKVWAMHREYCRVEELLRKKNLKRELAISRYYHMVRHRGTFIRISEEHKKEYAQQILQDWNQYYEDIKELDIEAKEGLFAWLRNLEKGGTVEEILAANLAVKEAIDRCRQIIIYGAGIWAEGICLRLYNMGYYDKIKKIWVSHTPVQTMLCGLPVQLFDKTVEDEDTLILIGVKGNGSAYCEIEQNLLKSGIKNYMNTDTIIHNFYLV